MTKNKLIFICMLILIINAMDVLAIFNFGVTEGIKSDLAIEDPTTTCQGELFNVLSNGQKNITLNNVTLDSDISSASYAYLYSATSTNCVEGGLLQKVALAGSPLVGKFTANNNFTVGQYFCILVGNEGVNYDRNYRPVFTSFPLIYTYTSQTKYVSFTSGCTGSFTAGGTDPYFNLYSIGFSVTKSLNLISPLDNAANNTLKIDFYFNSSNTTVCSLYTNSSGWGNVKNTSATANAKTNITYTFSQSGTYAWAIECDDSFSINHTLHIDMTNPVISNGLIPVVFNGSLYGQVNFSDEREIYSINLTWWNGTILFNKSNMGIKKYLFNFSHKVNATTSQYITSRICDSHTDSIMAEFNDIKYEDSGLKFVKEKEWFFFDKQYVKVYPKFSKDYQTASTDKLTDRNTFTFKKKFDASPTEIFIIESTDRIDIIGSQLYKGHIVTGNNWIDFENDYVTDVTFNRISPYKLEVNVYGLKGTEFKFNSIGELNCITQTLYYGNLNPSISYEKVILSKSQPSFSTSGTIDPNTMPSVKSILIYNTTKYSYPSINYDFTFTAPNATNQTIKYWNWLVNISGRTYNISSGNQTITHLYLGNCSQYSLPAFNYSVYDEDDNSAIVSNITFQIEYYSPLNPLYTSNLYSTYRNNYTYSFCKNINFSINADMSTSISSAGYAERIFNYEDTSLNGSLKGYILPIDSTHDIIVFEILSSDGDYLSDATMEIYRVVGGSNTLVYSGVSDGAGQVVVYLDQLYIYSFIVEKPGYPSKVFSLQPVSTSYTIILGESQQSFYSSPYDGIKYKLQLNGKDNLPNLINRTGTFQNITFIVLGGGITEIGMNFTDHPFTCIPASCANTKAGQGNVTVSIKANMTASFSTAFYFVKGGQKIFINDGIVHIVPMAARVAMDLTDLAIELKSSLSAKTMAVMFAFFNIAAISFGAAFGLFGILLVIPVITLNIVGMILGFIHPALGLLLIIAGVGMFILYYMKGGVQ